MQINGGNFMDDKIKIEASWTCKKELEMIPITDKLNCYRLTEYADGTVVSIEEGFTFDSNFSENRTIKRENSFFFFKNEIVEFELNTPFGFYGADSDKQKEFMIKNPFTFLEKCPDYDYGRIAMFIDYKIMEGRLMDLDGTYLPKAIVFNDINSIDNGNYDLDAVLEIIQVHPQVKMLSSERVSIPWYNATEESTHFLHFMYLPTHEEFNEAVKSGRDLHSFAIEKLGLHKFRKENN